MITSVILLDNKHLNITSIRIKMVPKMMTAINTTTNDVFPSKSPTVSDNATRKFL